MHWMLLIVVASIYYYYCGHVIPIVLDCARAYAEQDRQQQHKKYEYQHCKSAYTIHGWITFFASRANAFHST